MHSHSSSLENHGSSRCALTVTVEGENYEGFVALDSIVNGRSAGGVRITEELQVDEVRELAREMSKKFGLFLLPRGGAKAGLRLSSSLSEQERTRALENFGRRIAPLIQAGLYYPGMDLNCGPDALRAIYRGAGHELGAITDTSKFTALSVHHCLEACAERLSGSNGGPLLLAVEGFGSVARHLAERLSPERFRVMAVSTIEGAVLSDESFDPSGLAEAKLRSGDAFVHEIGGRRVSREDVLLAPVDILLPSSRTWVLDNELARTLCARAVVPIANAPYAAGSLELLEGRDVLCLPGYLSNVGGVLASSLHDLGVAQAEIESLFATEYRSVVDDILAAGHARGASPTAVCEQLLALHEPGRQSSPPRLGLAAKLFERFVRPRVPGAMRAGWASRDFRQRMAILRSELASAEEKP